MDEYKEAGDDMVGDWIAKWELGEWRDEHADLAASIYAALRAAHAAGRAEGLEAGAVGYADLDARHTDVLALTAGMPAVVEAAQHLLGTLNYANGSIPRRSVGYFLFDDGNNVHADIAKLRATLDALEGNNGA